MPGTGLKYLWLIVHLGTVAAAPPSTPPNPLSSCSSVPPDVFYLENQVKALASALHGKDQQIAEFKERLREKDAIIARMAKDRTERNLQAAPDEGKDFELK